MGMEGLEWLKDLSLTEERLEKVRKLSKIANDLGTSMPKLAIAWCLTNPNVSTVILGGSKVNHLEENIDALELVPQLNEEILNSIEEVLGNKPAHPTF